jgi:hypothetical protein
MYDVALFGHLIGVVALISAVVMTVSGLLRAQRAGSTSQIRVAMGGVPVADRVIPPAMLFVLGFGLYLVARHGDDGSIAWNAGWVDVSLVIFAVMACSARRSRPNEPKRCGSPRALPPPR